MKAIFAEAGFARLRSQTQALAITEEVVMVARSAAGLSSETKRL